MGSRRLLEHRSSGKLPHLLPVSRSKHLLPLSGLKVISESPSEDSGKVELLMTNRKLLLVGDGTSLSLSDFIDRQFSPRPRPSLLEPLERPRRLTLPHKPSRSRLRVV